MNTRASNSPKRIAIIGAGSSGLIALKSILDELPESDITVFEKTDSIVGCWGEPYQGFISTSTKFTTQFACYPVYDANVHGSAQTGFSDFFLENEYGEYLRSFANEFNLYSHIKLLHQVESFRWCEDSKTWHLSVRNLADRSNQMSQHEFDALVLCTGLAAQAKSVDLEIPSISYSQLRSKNGIDSIRDSKVVVMGGGESAVDHACRLARADLNNKVFLSLYTGIRVSPRYHPIRGVPSDFLRNRLMLSSHQRLRNLIGQKFVESRIRYAHLFRKVFPSRTIDAKSSDQSREEYRKAWDMRLTKAAKDDLFNMFHNKSEKFLDYVAEGRIKIVGAPVDRSGRVFHEFQSEQHVEVNANYVVPSIGFRSTIGELSGGAVGVEDFYLGCQSVKHPNLFLVGFARPIIGNIPSISEVQARYIACVMSGKTHSKLQSITAQHAHDRDVMRSEFSQLNLNATYPVEMIPYCDRVARLMNRYPSIRQLGSVSAWLRMRLAPATTMHYFLDNPRTKAAMQDIKIYMPWLLIGLLLMIKPIDWIYRLRIKLSRRKSMTVGPIAQDIPKSLSVSNVRSE